jgi:hypothetical protein
MQSQQMQSVTLKLVEQSAQIMKGSFGTVDEAFLKFG